MVDQILTLEDQQFQALISLMSEAKESVDGQEAETHQQTTSEYGSDEEEYDRLFMDVMSEPQQASGSQTGIQDSRLTETQDMDISME